MVVYICQIRYLCVTNEKIESSCVTCLGSYLKSGSSPHFLTWAETAGPLYLSLGNCLETMRWSQKFCCWRHWVRISLMLLGFSSTLFVFNKSLCWLIGNMYPKVYWNKDQLHYGKKENAEGEVKNQIAFIRAVIYCLYWCVSVLWFLKTTSRSIFLALSE